MAIFSASCKTDAEKLPAGSVSLTGAGSSFDAVLFNRWFTVYHESHPNVYIKYDSVGSGEGVSRFIGKNLSAEDVKKLRKLIEDADSFNLQSSPPQSPVPPDPSVGFDLTVDMDGRTNTIWVRDTDVSKSLTPLIDWLKAREKPAIRIEIQKSGGIAGRIFPPTTLESSKLSADDARKLDQLLTDVRFFELPESYPAHGADLFGYTITVEQNGKRHSVSFDDTPEELKPLMDWLAGQAFAKDSLPR